VLPEIALAKVRQDAPFDKICYIGCGVTTGIGAVIYTAKVGPGANFVVFGLGGIGLNVIQGARMAGADMIVGVDIDYVRISASTLTPPSTRDHEQAVRGPERHGDGA
jgi:S-(hydroxymethyl)glutathione dehydrogenase/alcohol dehydrogenase